MDQQECDEAQSLQAPDGINLNSHLDVFYAILRQVSVLQGESRWPTRRMRNIYYVCPVVYVCVCP